MLYPEVQSENYKKTLKCCCTSRVMWRHVMQWRHMTSRHDQMTSWHHTIGQDLIFVHSHQKILKMAFLTSWPWPLTYDLDQQTHSRYYQCQPLYQISWPCVKWFGCESANKQTHTHRHTNGSVSISSTADAGGNNVLNGHGSSFVTQSVKHVKASLLIGFPWFIIFF